MHQQSVATRKTTQLSGQILCKDQPIQQYVLSATNYLQRCNGAGVNGRKNSAVFGKTAKTFLNILSRVLNLFCCFWKTAEKMFTINFCCFCETVQLKRNSVVFHKTAIKSISVSAVNTCTIVPEVVCYGNVCNNVLNWIESAPQ